MPNGFSFFGIFFHFAPKPPEQTPASFLHTLPPPSLLPVSISTKSLPLSLSLIIPPAPLYSSSKRKMENSAEKNLIIECNAISLLPGEDFVGALLRRPVSSTKWRALVYAKRGIFLEEFRPASNRQTDFPREVIDLSGVKVEEEVTLLSGVNKTELLRVFQLIARNGKVRRRRER